MHTLWYPVQSVAQDKTSSAFARNGPRSFKSKPPAFPRLSNQQAARDKIGLSKVGSGTRENSLAQRGCQSRPPTRERTPHASLSYRPARRADHAGENATAPESTTATPTTALPRVVSCEVRGDRMSACASQHAAPTRAASSVRRPPPLATAPRTVRTAEPSARRTDTAEWSSSDKSTSTSTLAAKHQLKGASSSQEATSTQSDSGVSVLPSATTVSSHCDSSASGTNANSLKSAVDSLLSLRQISIPQPSSAKACCLTGWLPHEPALERSAIYAPQGPSGAAGNTRRVTRTAKHRKVNTSSSAYSFQHYSDVEDYCADYLRHHSFTYTSVTAIRLPLPPPGGVRYSTQQSDSNTTVAARTTEEVKTVESSESPPESSRSTATTKAWMSLIKQSYQQPAAAAPIKRDFVLLATGTDQPGLPAGGIEPGKQSRPATSENESGGFKRTPLVAIKEEQKDNIPSGSSISVGKYLIIKSNEDQELPCSGSQQKGEEEDDEGFGSASMDSLVNRASSFIRECESGASLSSCVDSHGTVVDSRLPLPEKEPPLPDMYKYPSFKPVLPAEKRSQRATDHVMNKARNLGLISPFVLREAFIQELLQGNDTALTIKQARANSSLLRKASSFPHQANKPAEKEKFSRRQSAAPQASRQPSSSVAEARQRKLNAVMKAYGCKEKPSAKGRDSSKSSSNSTSNVPPANTSAVCTKVLLLQKRAKASGKTRLAQSIAHPGKTNLMVSALQIGPSANFPPIK